MKTLVLGDIHGRPIWRDIIENENPDRIIFLGDYVSSHALITEEDQISNLNDILSYKEENQDKVILLRGNHDVQHLGYSWAKCSGLFPKVLHYMSEPENTERFLKNTQWIYIDEELKTIFSHAGISSVWIEEYVEPYLVKKIGPQYDDGTIDMENILQLINEIKPCELFGFTPDNYFDMSGYSKTQPLTWIRPETLCTCNIKGYDQVIGHTMVKEISNVFKSSKGNQNIWLCDSLGFKNYLVIENRNFISKTL